MRKSKFRILPAIVSLSLAAALFGAVALCPAAEDAASPSGGKELAVRYASLAQETLRQKVVVAPHFKEAAGLIMAAMKLDPTEPRYPRMLYEAMKTIGDVNGQLK